jgi:hypothetical protein
MEPQGWSTTPGIWLGAIGTLALFSLLYKENRVYRLFEHLFIGLAGGYLIKTTWTETLKPQWWVPMTETGQWPWMFVLGIGLLFYTIYLKRYNWMSRISIGILLGFVAGQIFQQTSNEFIPQIKNSFKPLIVNQSDIKAASQVTAFGQSLTNIAFVVVVLCVLSYFFFSFEQKNKVLNASSRTGRLMMMFAFGSMFGATVMARMALLIDRVWFLMHRWLGFG